MNDTSASKTTPAQRAESTHVWLLLSGGIDSAACLSFYLAQGFTVECLHISFGQPSLARERTAATLLACHYGVPLRLLRWSSQMASFTTGEIVGRNAFLLFASLMEIGDRSGVLAIGIHAGTDYYDCSTSFLHLMQTTINGYCAGRIRIAAPFIDWSKQHIYSFCDSTEVPIHLAYSCEKGTCAPCGLCLSCRDRKQIGA